MILEYIKFIKLYKVLWKSAEIVEIQIGIIKILSACMSFMSLSPGIGYIL